MKYAIISAGEGSRLAQEGVALPKPLVEIGGEAMIDRLIRIFSRQGAEEVAVIINNEVEATKKHLLQLQQRTRIPLRVVVQTTPSSMHSFHVLSPWLRGGRLCLTTVDTIFREEEFSRFIQSFEQSDADGMMAVTDYVDDEKPLYVATTPTLDITGFHDTPVPEARFISGGIYCLTEPCLDVLEDCVSQGMSRMRNYQRSLVATGMRLKAFPFSKILDVDHASDIAKAEAFIHAQNILS